MTDIKETYQVQCMQCGFKFALHSLEEYFDAKEYGNKDRRLHNYKGMKLLIKKLNEKWREFFIKGKDVQIYFTEQEFEALKCKPKKKSEKIYKGD